MAQIRVVLADDHRLVRAGLRALLERLPDIEVVGEAADGQEAVRLIRSQSPDLALLDIAMPGLNGIEATARITRDFPNMRVIVISVHGDAESVLSAIEAGVAGYLLKDAGVEELERAIRTVSAGGTYLTPAASQHVVEQYRRMAEDPEAVGVPGSAERRQLARLTPRQREILQLLADGSSARKIARNLSLSVKTVETHRAQLMERLGIHDLAGLVRFAIRAGLIRAEDD